MDIKRKVFDELIFRYNRMYAFEKANIEAAAKLIKGCVENGGVVQVCGVGHGEEFRNELNFRAGGMAYVHGINVDDFFVRNMITSKQKEEFFDHRENADYLDSFYEFDDRDIFVLVSLKGDEELLLEIAKRAHAKHQKVIAVCNRANTTKKTQDLLDICDLVLDICSDSDDSLVNFNGQPFGQAWTTVSNVMAQMITGEVYRLYHEEGKECPILLSANLKGADIHNNALTDPYGRRIRG